MDKNGHVKDTQKKTKKSLISPKEHRNREKGRCLNVGQLPKQKHGHKKRIRGY